MADRTATPSQPIALWENAPSYIYLSPLGPGAADQESNPGANLVQYCSQANRQRCVRPPLGPMVGGDCARQPLTLGLSLGSPRDGAKSSPCALCLRPWDAPGLSRIKGCLAAGAHRGQNSSSMSTLGEDPGVRPTQEQHAEHTCP